MYTLYLFCANRPRLPIATALFSTADGLVLPVPAAVFPRNHDSGWIDPTAVAPIAFVVIVQVNAVLLAAAVSAVVSVRVKVGAAELSSNNEPGVVVPIPTLSPVLAI